MLRARILAIIAAFTLALGGAPAIAQGQLDPAGYWIGGLQINAQVVLRIAVDITAGEDGSLSGTLDSPDQNSFGTPLADVALQFETLVFSVPSIGASYQGSWDLERQWWDGTFTQAGQSWPLVLATGDPADRPEPVALPESWAVPDNAALSALLDQRISGRVGAVAVLGVSEFGAARIVARGPDGELADGDQIIFEIGSMTKVFTSLILADMAAKGELSLDDPVVNFLPQGASMPTHGAPDGTVAQITLRNLSLQNSGLPRLPGNMPFGDVQDPYADYTEALLLEFLASYELTRDIGSEYEYSNLGSGLLGYALARAAGSDFEDLVTQRILAPLGMANTAITLSSDQQARFAIGYDEYMRPTKPWHLPWLEGAGALRSTASDMLMFLDAALDPASPIAAMMALASSEKLGWMPANPPSGEMLHHGGGTGGFRTHMALQPATGRAIVVLTNAAVEPSAQDLAFHTLVGSPVAVEAAVPAAPPTPPERDEVTLSTAQREHVVGTYQMAPGMVMDVAYDGSELTVQLTGQPRFTLYASAPLEFFLRVVDARVVFLEDDGVISGATLLQNGREIPMVKFEQDENTAGS